MNITQLLNYPIRGDKIKENIILAISLSLFSFIIPVIYYMGYVLEVIKYTMNKKELPPVLNI